MANTSETVSTNELSMDIDLPNSSGFKDKTPDSCRNLFLNNNNLISGLNQNDNTMKISTWSSSLPPLPRSKSCPLVNLAPPVSLEEALEHELIHGPRKLDPEKDKKKIRRTVSNRLSAQRSRVRKAEYVLGMEKLVVDLQVVISNLKPQVESYKESTKLLLLENDCLKKAIENRSNDSELREKELEENILLVEMFQQLQVQMQELNSKLREEELEENRLQVQMFQQLQDQMQELDVNPFPVQVQPYPTIIFYQNRLQDMHYHKETDLPSTSASRVKVEATSEFEHQMQDQEDANIDQYLNFDIMN